MTHLRQEIARVINSVSAENGSNTPDFILAEYLGDCLAAFDKAISAREKWYGREAKPVPYYECPNEPQSLREHANEALKPVTHLDCVGTEGGKATTTTIKP